MTGLLPYLQLVRLPNIFTALADIVLAALVTGIFGPFEPETGLRWSRIAAFICLLVASALLYWSGMIWNDYFDLDEDRRDRPGRPLASGRIAIGTAMWLGVGCMVGGVLFAFATDLCADRLRFVSTSVALALVVAILLYDGALKETWMGPIMMGGCRFLNILLGLTVGGDFPPAWGFLLALVVGVYIGGVTFFARTEAKNSNPSDLTTAALVIAGSLVMALAVPALAQARATEVTTAIVFPYLLVAFAFYLGLAMVPAIRSPVPIRVQSAVKRALLGLVVLDALLASSMVGIVGLLLALLVLPGIYLGRWLYST